jgi:hypothetical protein
MGGNLYLLALLAGGLSFLGYILFSLDLEIPNIDSPLSGSLLMLELFFFFSCSYTFSQCYILNTTNATDLKVRTAASFYKVDKSINPIFYSFL